MRKGYLIHKYYSSNKAMRIDNTHLFGIKKHLQRARSGNKLTLYMCVTKYYIPTSFYSMRIVIVPVYYRDYSGKNYVKPITIIHLGWLIRNMSFQSRYYVIYQEYIMHQKKLNNHRHHHLKTFDY